ncbi:hypothetical protein NDU88_005515 [Pleurodeles waltl]|uniref:Uncharacterized protein n=1 Tax=Pleurodeles waltl TaxID=8319 RepID=A0AAV7MD31_PLEWA|nr:hypothetical protein NDU88_005515 [Pleurodeles waltl]
MPLAICLLTGEGGAFLVRVRALGLLIDWKARWSAVVFMPRFCERCGACCMLAMAPNAAKGSKICTGSMLLAGKEFGLQSSDVIVGKKSLQDGALKQGPSPFHDQQQPLDE